MAKPERGSRVAPLALGTLAWAAWWSLFAFCWSLA